MIDRQPNMNELREIEQIFKEKYPKAQGNVWDGIVDLQKFSNATCKILWILKETNGTDFSDLREALSIQSVNKHLGGFHYVYTKVVLVSHAILTGDWSNTRKADALCGDILPQIAVINVKKQGGGAQASGSVIHSHYKENKELLLRQVQAINPNLIIHANRNTDLFAALDPDPEKIEKIWPFEVAYQKGTGRVLIKAYHPGCRISSIRYLELVRHALQSHPLQ